MGLEMGILLAFFSHVLVAGSNLTKWSSTPGPVDPYSPTAIFERIYGPPIVEGDNNASPRASSAEFPMVVSAYEGWTVTDKQSNQTFYGDTFKAGGIIISDMVVISICSRFFRKLPSGELVLTEIWEEVFGTTLDYDEPQPTKTHLFFSVLAGFGRKEPDENTEEDQFPPQRIPVANFSRHEKCGETMGTQDAYMYDTVALMLSKPILFNLHVRQATFYSEDLNTMLDKLEEMQEVNSKCHIVVPSEINSVGIKDKAVLYSSLVQVVSERECNNLYCMVGIDSGSSCQNGYNLKTNGLFCTLSADGNIPCNIAGGILICDHNVYGIAAGDYCLVCAPHTIATPHSLLDLVKKHSTLRSKPEYGIATDEESTYL